MASKKEATKVFVASFFAFFPRRCSAAEKIFADVHAAGEHGFTFFAPMARTSVRPQRFSSTIAFSASASCVYAMPLSSKNAAKSATVSASTV